MPAKVLVVDDEANIRELVRLYLEKDGYQVHEAEDGEKAVALADELRPDLVVLDVMLPGIDGIQVCSRLKSLGDAPVIMLSAKSEEGDKIQGLDTGADDYVTKPFSPRELLARVRSVLRRSRAAAEDVLEFPDFTVNRTAREVTVRGEPVQCTAKEFDLLWLLASRPNQVFTRENLLEQVWDYAYYGDLRTVDVHVRRLREKIEPDPDEPCYIITVWGVGYKFRGVRR
ncbi:MAG: response regulator transcription factor [Firmicutes bacterium]|nr:response regulator transcription factor [Bacillota bacterium]